MLPCILFIAILSLASTAHSHLVMALPSTWGLDTSLENPLTQRTSNWVCGGRQRPANGPVTTIQAGQVLHVPVTCGEAIHNLGGAAYQCATDSDGTNDYHGGGGCALSIAYTSSPRVEDFVVFSVNHDCPRAWSTWIPFNVPINLPAGEATMAWTWIPPSTHAQPEMYFNCATVRVQGPSAQLTGGRRLLDHIYGVPGFSSRTPSPIYRNVLPNGALQISTSAGGGGQCQSGHARCTSDPSRWEHCASSTWYSHPVPANMRCVQEGSLISWAQRW
ncbi:hypothetical protein BCR44DRAFT_35494 [Catenaria anguillulae PL171]|uniref:Chitin-binding type-4 domain-containing protein n=1 Tax=Catenaria anguillulae PL171 TaxID=765915 RepID=A0A1Y2HML7_9FUNG|nr:hypothetical protein BCR44DRAFT_35494 [Catenaria anguillulae PL171]